MQEENDCHGFDNSFLRITIRSFGEDMTFRMGPGSTVGNLKKQFCDQTKDDVNKTRFLLNGERLEDESILDFLNLEERDQIEVFQECRGGGPPTKKYLLNSDEKILDALDESLEFSESDEEKSNEESGCEEVFSHSSNEVGIDHHQIGKEDKEEARETLTKKQEIDNMTNPSLQDPPESDENDMDDNEWFESLRKEFNNGKFFGKKCKHCEN